MFLRTLRIAMACLLISTIGLARATTKLKLACLAYNFDRLIFLGRRLSIEESI